jgi:hypothetical protein
MRWWSSGRGLPVSKLRGVRRSRTNRAERPGLRPPAAALDGNPFRADHHFRPHFLSPRNLPTGPGASIVTSDS